MKRSWVFLEGLSVQLILKRTLKRQTSRSRLHLRSLLSFNTAGRFNTAVALGIFITAFVLGALIISFLPKTYESNATILVRPMSDFVLDPTEAAIGGSFQERVNNQVALLRADATASHAQALLREFLQSKRCHLCEKVLPGVRLGLLSDQYQVGGNYGERLRQSIVVQPRPNSHVVRVSYRSNSDRSQDLRTLLSLYLTAFQAESAGFGKQLIQEQLKSVRSQRALALENRQEAQRALDEFRRSHQTLDPNLELNSWVMEQSRLREALQKTQAELAAVERAQQETKTALALSVPTVRWLSRLALDEELNGLRQQVSEIYADKAQWLIRAGLLSKARPMERTLTLPSDLDLKGPDIRQEQTAQTYHFKAPDPALMIKLQTLDEEIDYLNQLIQKRIKAQLENWQKMAGQQPSDALKSQLSAGDIPSVGSIDVQLAIRVLEEDIQRQALGVKRVSLQKAVSGLDAQLKRVPALQLDFAKLQASSQLSNDRLSLLALQQSRLETAQTVSTSHVDTIPKLVMLQKPLAPVDPIAPHYPLLYALLGLFSSTIAIMAGRLASQARSVSPSGWSENVYANAQPSAHEPEDEDAFAMPTPKKSQAKKSAFTFLPVLAWPFGKSKDREKSAQVKSKQKKIKKPEKRILTALPQSPSPHAHEAMAPAFKRTFHLDPLPGLNAFLGQLEGENPPDFQSKGLADLRDFFSRMRQQSRIQRVGFMPVSAFPTAQSTLLALSLLLADSGQKLALIDVDYSAVSLSCWISSFPIPLGKGIQEGPGVCEYIEGMATDFVDVIYPLGKSVYGSFIPAGHLGSVKDMALGSEQLVKIGGDMSPHYDFVFYALPALESTQQALQAAASLDAVVLISHPGITKKNDEQQAIRLVQQYKLPLLAILEQP